MAEPAHLVEGGSDDLHRQGRTITLVREMSEDHPGQPRMHEFRNEPGRRLVRQVSVTRGDPPLHRGRVRAGVQHDLVVVGLENEQVASRQCVADLRRGAAQVGGDAEPEARALVDQGDADRIRCVVHGQERLHPEVPDQERPSLLVLFDSFLATEQLRARLPGPGGHVQRCPVAAGKDADPRGVVAVLVCDDDRSDVVGVHADTFEPCRDRLATEAGIHEDLGVSGSDVDRVPATAAPQNGDLHGESFTRAVPPSVPRRSGGSRPLRA